MTRNDLDALTAALKKLRSSADDKTASESVGAFPRLHGDGRLIHVGTRILWKGRLKKAAVDLWDTAENTPDAAPTLWVDISYREGIRIIPAVITVADAFGLGELGWWEDVKYRSLLAANVYTPAAYPRGWEALDE